MRKHNKCINDQKKSISNTTPYNQLLWWQITNIDDIEVSWRVVYKFKFTKTRKKPSGILWWMSKLDNQVLRDPTEIISLANIDKFDHHFRAFPKIVTKICYPFWLWVSPSKFAVFTYILKNIIIQLYYAKFEYTVRFYKGTGFPQRWQVYEKLLLLSTDRF